MSMVNILIQNNPRVPKLQSYTWFCEHGQKFQSKPIKDCPSYKATPDFVSMVKISIQTNPGLPKLKNYTWFCEHSQIFTPSQAYFKPELESYNKFWVLKISILLGLPKRQSYTWFCEHGQHFNRNQSRSAQATKLHLILWKSWKF